MRRTESCGGAMALGEGEVGEEEGLEEEVAVAAAEGLVVVSNLCFDKNDDDDDDDAYHDADVPVMIILFYPVYNDRGWGRWGGAS